MTGAPDDEQGLRDILEAIQDVREFNATSPRKKKERYAITYCFVIIGEASNNLSEETRDAAPGIPWREIINLRHLLAHRYWNLDFEEIDKIIEHELDPLEAAIQQLLAEDDTPSPDESA